MVLLQGLGRDRPQIPRKRRRILADDPVVEDKRCRAFEGPRAADRLVQENTQRPDVGRGTRLGSLHLLRRHVVGRAEDRPRAGQILPSVDSREAEVREHDPAIGLDHDVLRLEVAVDHALGVRVGDGPGHGLQDLQTSLGGQPGRKLRQRLPLD